MFKSSKEIKKREEEENKRKLKKEKEEITLEKKNILLEISKLKKSKTDLKKTDIKKNEEYIEEKEEIVLNNKGKEKITKIKLLTEKYENNKKEDIEVIENEILELEIRMKKIKDREEEFKEKQDKKNILIEAVSEDDSEDSIVNNKSEEIEITEIRKIKKDLEKNYENKANVQLKTLNNDGVIIDHIIHLADIHIRLSKRHYEYSLVFEKLYENLENYKLENPNTLIVICGDILEKKNELDPNTIMFTWNFIKKLSLIFPVILIAGNHDLIEESDHIDTITAILEDRPLYNIHYLIDSGAYIYNNIIFGVSSIKDGYIMTREKLDEKIKNIEINYNEDKIKRIVLYHGEIKGAKTLNPNYEYYTDCETSINLFGTYDYYLLGDIHKFQYLDDNKRACYAGSLISQNRSETDIHHGYVEWNIETGESKHQIIENEYSFGKLAIEDLQDNREDKMNELKDKLSIELIIKKLERMKKGNLTLLINKMSEKEINLIKKEIHNIYSNIKIKFQEKIKTVLPGSTEEKILKDNEKNINDVTVLKDTSRIDNMTKEFITKRYPKIVKNDTILNKIMSILFNLKLKYNKNETKYENLDWKLVWLKFDNFFSFGTGNEINFIDNTINNESLIGFFGKNSTGKSLIIDILCYMLFSRSGRDPMSSSRNPKDLINLNSTEAMGMLLIESGGIYYLIERICKREKNKSWNKNRLKFYELRIPENESEIDNNKKFVLYGKTYILTSRSLIKTNTEKDIQSIVGTYEHFLTTSVLLQGNNKTFRSKTNVEKINIFSDILQIGYFNDISQIIKLQYQDLNKDREKYLENIVNICEIVDQYTTNKKLKDIINHDNIEEDLDKIKTKFLEQYNKELENINEIILSKLDTQLINTQTKINNKYNEIEHLIKKLSKDEILDITILQTKINDLILKSKEYTTELNQNIFEMNNIKKLYLEKINNKILDNEKTIINDYDIFIQNKKINQTELINKIKILTDEKQHNVFKNIVNNYNDSDIDQQINLNNDIISTYYKDINSLTEENSSYNLIQQTDHIKIENNKHLDILQSEKNNMILKKLAKQKLLEDLLEDLENENVERENENIKLKKIKKEIKLLNKDITQLENNELIKLKDNIISEYNDFMKNKENILDKTLIKLKEKINLSTNKQEMILLVDKVISTINVILKKDNQDNHEIVIKYRNMLLINEQFNKLNNNKTQLLEQLAIINKNIEIIENIETLNEEIIQIDDDICNFKINNIYNYDLLLEQEYKYNNNLILLDEINTKIKSTLSIIEILKQDKENILINQLINKKNSELNDEIEKINNDLNNINEDPLNNYNNLQEQKKIVLEYNKIIYEMEIKNKEINDKLDNTKETIDKYNLNIIKQNENIIINDNIDKIKKEIIPLQSELIQIQEDINKYKNKNDKIKIKVEELERNIQHYDKISEDYGIYKVLSDIVASDGLRLFLLEQSISFINNRLNDILKNSLDVGKTVLLTINHEKSIDVIIKSNEGTLKTISGSESFLIDLAFKIIITEITELPKCNSLFIDESISVLDVDRINDIDNFFEFIGNYYNTIFLITHLNNVKNSMHCSISIKTKNGKSYINNSLNKLTRPDYVINYDDDNDFINDNDDDITISDIINNNIEKSDIKPNIKTKKITRTKTKNSNNYI